MNVPADSGYVVRLYQVTEAMFIPIRRHGQLVLPDELCKRCRLDQPGAQVEIVERGDGVIELRPHAATHSEQRWFWSDRWQRMEAAADADIDAGRVVRSDDAESFLDELDTDA